MFCIHATTKNNPQTEEPDIVHPKKPYISCIALQHTATHCSTLQHTATHCNTLQHTATSRSSDAIQCIPRSRENNHQICTTTFFENSRAKSFVPRSYRWLKTSRIKKSTDFFSKTSRICHEIFSMCVVARGTHFLKRWVEILKSSHITQLTIKDHYGATIEEFCGHVQIPEVPWGGYD